MLKKFFAVIFLATVIFFGGQNNFASAQDVYVGTSNATGWDCYVMTETISRSGGTTYVTLKMITGNGNVRYLDYRFWYDSRSDVMRFSNGNFSGIANRYETPIEWEMVQVIRNY